MVSWFRAIGSMLKNIMANTAIRRLPTYVIVTDFPQASTSFLSQEALSSQQG